MSKFKELQKKFDELEKKCDWLQSLINFGVVMKHSDYRPHSPCYAENIAHEETVNKMLRDGYASGCTFNNTFYVRYFCDNLYRAGYRKFRKEDIEMMENEDVKD